MSRKEQETSPLRNVDKVHTITPHSGSDNVAKVSSERLPIEERLASKMFSYGREIICFLLAITFTALAAFHSSPSKVSKPPVAKPFFNENSIVFDFYKGHWGAMIERVTDSDFSFVMYYAPWDAESQAIRQEFEKTAQYYHSQIFFAAINCWHPNSECRIHVNKIQSYPVLMFYPSRESGIQYRGIRSSSYMIKFLNSIINPLVRITQRDQLAKLLVDHDAVLVGHFNCTRLDRTPGYNEFHRASMRTLEKDPNREVSFAAITDVGTSWSDYGVEKFPSATLVMWNESWRYPEEHEWNSESILNWVGGKLHQPAGWLQPPGLKSLTLAPYLREGPVLFLFTPRNPFHRVNYNYNLLREIGLQYFGYSPENVWVTNISKRLQQSRRTAPATHSKKTKECIELLKLYEPRTPNEPSVTISVQEWINDTCCDNVVMNKCTYCKEEAPSSAPMESSISSFSINNELARVCNGVDVFKLSTAPVEDQPEVQVVVETNKEKSREEENDDRGEKDTIGMCCKKQARAELVNDLGSRSQNTRRRGAGVGNNDSRSASMVRQAYLKESCRRWLTGNKYHRPVFPRDYHLELEANVTLEKVVHKGNSNRTLTLIAMDSLEYHHFAEGLGIDILKRKDKTAVAILDTSDESQYVLQDDFSEKSLVQFINNYTQGFLQRTLRSNNSRRFTNKFRTTETAGVTCSLSNRIVGKRICISELTTETFLSTILDRTKDVIVMYHSPYCAFCSAISYVYLTVSYYLREMDHLLFVRVDGDNNDLPWEYSMNRYPSILFFPAKRKEDSTVYPFSLPITIPNLLNFVLANLDEDSHVEALVNICQSESGEPPDKCILRTRWLCLDIVQQLLWDYRKLMRHLNFLDTKTAQNVRKTILLKLQHMKDVHLILGSTVNLIEDQHIVRLIQRKYKKYYRTLRSLVLDEQTRKKTMGASRVNRLEKVNVFVSRVIRDEL